MMQPAKGGEGLLKVLEGAIGIALKAHAGQVDRDGSPYVLHPLRVMLRMESMEERIVAVLHDAWDTSGRIREDIVILMDGQDAEPVMRIMEALAQFWRHEDLSYGDFLRRIAADPLARRVKLADLDERMELSRITEPTAADHARNRRYEAARVMLLGAASSEQ